MSWKTSRPSFKRLIPRRLSWKLTLIYAILFSAVLIALNAGTLFGVRYFMLNQAKSQVRGSSTALLKKISSASGNTGLVDPNLLRETDNLPEISVLITDNSGKPIGKSGKNLSGLPHPSANIGNILVTEWNDRHFITENNRIPVKGTLAGYLQVSYDMRSEYHFIKLLFIFMAFADFIGVAFSILAGFLLSRRALKPIDSLTRTARQISISDLSQRVESGPADDELSRLAVTFNEMIERLQLSFEKQNRFVADASHELRTPIAIIQGYAGLIEQWAKNDPEVLEESIAAIRKEAKGMTSLIEELLFLARGDSGRLVLQKEACQVSALLDEIIEESSLVAPNDHFERTASESLRLVADRKLIKQALRALVDNAVKYTPANGNIHLEASRTDKQIIIRVRDTGIGIPESEQSKLFDRFYRVDKDRSREKGGSGLGLSIVKRIVEAHQGTIKIESQSGKGTCVIIRLPAEPI